MSSVNARSHVWTLIVREVVSRKMSILWWIIGIGAFITLNISTYPAFKDQAAELEASMNQLPESMRQMFSDTGEFMSPVGFLSSQVFYLMLPMLFSFLTIGLGASLIAREEQRKTIELLLARPVSRGKLLVGKALGGLSVAGAVGLGTALICFIDTTLVKFDGVQLSGVLAATGMSMLLALLFGAIAFMFTAMGTLGRGASIAVAALIAIGGYVVSSLDSTVTWLQGPAKVFPYHYYEPAKMLEGNASMWPPIVFSGIILILIAIAWVAFRRRDIE